MPLKHTGTVPDANKLLLMVRLERMRLMGSEHSDSEGRCYSWCQSTSGVLDRVFSSIDARIDSRVSHGIRALPGISLSGGGH